MSTQYRYYVADVFTHQRFGGNPLAVIPDAAGLSTQEMQQIAREFNFSETTFVLPPQNHNNTCQVRIFTPLAEIPFAGHPTLGTAFVLVQQGLVPVTGTETVLQLEEGVGTVPVHVKRKAGQPDFLQFSAAHLPEFAEGADALADIGAALGIPTDEIGTESLPISIVSCGMPFLIVPVKRLATLQQLQVNEQLIRRKAEHLPHWRSVCVLSTETVQAQADLHVRMFAPWFGVPEDPATGSAAAALAGYLGHFQAGAEGTFSWVIEQGLEMGRPSTLYAEAEKINDQFQAVRVGGQAVMVMSGLCYV